jgi:threonine synthase
MGLPIGQLVVATNENNVLDEFFKTGRYRPRGTSETYLTSSPSMDISKASNFERYIYDLVGRDPQRLAVLWRSLSEDGEFVLTEAEQGPAVTATGLVSGTSRHVNRLDTIRDVSGRYGRVIDPHTADGVYVARQYLRAGVPMLCLETALPAKFEETILEALGRPAPRPPGLEALESLPQRVQAISQDVAALKALIEEEALRAVAA